MDGFLYYYNNSQKTLPLKVYGYPGEKDKRGDPYEMIGSISNVTPKDGGSFIAYNDIDTTHGQSGSPVLVYEDELWSIIGIHQGYDSDSESNVASIINENILEWIKSNFS